MPKVSVFDMNGKEVGTTELADSIFGIEENKAVLHQAVKVYLANQRQGTQSTLTRAEVRGGGIKPWRQKGTGRARQGSIRAPQWTHGGIAFGPKPRDFRIAMNKKQKKLALKLALSSKAASESIIVVDDIKVSEIKTKTIANMLKALGVEKKAMFVTAENSKELVLSARNIPGTETAFVGELNVYDILNSGKLIVSQDALAKIEEVYA